MRWLPLAIVLAGCSSLSVVPDEPDPPAAGWGDLYAGFHRVEDLLPFRDRLVANGSAEPLGIEDASVLGADVVGIRLRGDDARVRVLFDGGIHGNEVYGQESVMYLAAWLVANQDNETVARVLDGLDVHLLFQVNPDGRAANSRNNANGVDLNRNFPVDFGNPNPLCRSQSLSGEIPYYYAGPEPLSEPESQAIAAYMEEMQPHIYLNYHTGRHALIRPWAACDAPYEMPERDDQVFEALEAWTRKHTTYQNTGTAHETANRAFPPGAASGSSMDWCYMAYHCLGLVMEVTTLYGEHDTPPEEIAQEAFPIAWHILENAQDYAMWRVPPAAQEAYAQGHHLKPVPEHLKTANPI